MISESEKFNLNESAIEVFGTMYFTPIELLEEIPPKEKWQLESTYIRTAIGYSGPLQAQMQFFFPRSLAKSIAEGFLGLDDSELTEAQIVDTMREAANMIIGNFLGKLDPNGDCTLGIPEAEAVTDFSPETAGHGKESLAFFSDFGFLWLFFD